MKGTNFIVICEEFQMPTTTAERIIIENIMCMPKKTANTILNKLCSLSNAPLDIIDLAVKRACFREGDKEFCKKYNIYEDKLFDINRLISMSSYLSELQHNTQASKDNKVRYVRRAKKYIPSQTTKLA
jgi:hypothetical protein